MQHRRRFPLACDCEPLVSGAFIAEETGTRNALSWREFVDAMSELVTCSCCGAAAADTAALARPRPAKVKDPAQWAIHPAAKGARLPVREGRYVLPEVSVCSPGDDDKLRADVLIEQGSIAAIRPHGASDWTGADVVEECRGLWVSPALIDMHAHMPIWNGLRLPRLFLLQTLRHGVARLRDAGDLDGSATPAALALVRSGRLPGPQVHYAYAFITGAGRSPWANTMQVGSEQDARNVVATLASLGASWVKTYENLTPPLIRALSEAAHASGLGVMGHVPTRFSLEQAAIPDGQHYFGVAPPQSLRRDHIFERHVAWEAVDSARLDAVVRAAVENRLAQTPTLRVTEQILELERYEEARVAPKYRNALPSFYPDVIWHPSHGLPVYRNLTPTDFDRVRYAIDGKRELTRRLHAAGGVLRIGTDTQQPFVLPGAALLEEMQSFAACGVPYREAWAMATRDAASALGLDDVGVAREGARADLLVSRVDPRHGITAANNVALVTNGKLAMMGDIDAAIEAELGRFRGVIAEHVGRWLIRFAVKRIARDFDRYQAKPLTFD